MSLPYDSSAEGLMKQAGDDARASKYLFEKRHYGTSAYLCQQSIEKTVKSIMIEYGLTCERADQLRHTPIAELLRMQSRNARRLASETDNAKTKKVYDGLSELLGQGSRMFLQPRKEGTLTRMVWWKTSLGMKLTPDENDKIKKLCSNLMRKHGSRVDTLSKHVTELAGGRHARSMLGKNITRTVAKKSTNVGELVASASSPADLFRQIEPVLGEMAQTYGRMAQQLRTTQPDMYHYTAMLAWVVENEILILMITPHEDIGRYPIRVCGLESIDWYRKKRAELKELEDLVDGARRELPRRMNPRFRQRRQRVRMPRWLYTSGNSPA